MFLDVTGGDEVATSQALTIVRATVAAVEAELRIDRIAPRRSTMVEVEWAVPTLDVLGRHGADFKHGSTRLATELAAQ